MQSTANQAGPNSAVPGTFFPRERPNPEECGSCGATRRGNQGETPLAWRPRAASLTARQQRPQLISPAGVFFFPVRARVHRNISTILVYYWYILKKLVGCAMVFNQWARKELERGDLGILSELASGGLWVSRILVG